MTPPGPNLPLVIQQAGKVSQVQESVQRAGEHQQAAAQNQAAQKNQLKRSQVQQSDGSETRNRIRSDADQKQQQRHKRQRKKGKGAGAEIAALPPAGGGLLVDEVV